MIRSQGQSLSDLSLGCLGITQPKKGERQEEIKVRILRILVQKSRKNFLRCRGFSFGQIVFPLLPLAVFRERRTHLPVCERNTQSQNPDQGQAAGTQHLLPHLFWDLEVDAAFLRLVPDRGLDRKSTRLNSSHLVISYAVFCLKKKKKRRNSI